MKIVKPKVEILEQGPGIEGMYKAIELAGRQCYQSSHLIGEDTAKPFVERMIKDGHLAMLEHGAVYLQMPLNKVVWRAFELNPYSRVSAIEECGAMFISTNYRVIVENKLEDLMKYIVEYGPMHDKRVTARFQTQIAISREFNRHRVNSVAESSTRYCNYSKDKFGNEITVCLPVWIELEEAEEAHKTLRPEHLGGRIDLSAFRMDNPIHTWVLANIYAEQSYLTLTKQGWGAQQARTALPLDTMTTLVHTAFVSDWQHFFDLRSRGTTGKPHPDAKVLADDLLKQFIERGYVKCE